MSAWSTLAGGLVGSLVLTTVMRSASALRLTRIDIPFLLGTAVTESRVRARAVGYALHLAAGIGFAAIYFALFAALGDSSWWLGALFGLLHGLVVLTGIADVLVPLVHPRVGTPMTAAHSFALLEPPGFMFRNYGRSTPVVILLAHVLYGAIVGAFASGA